jgi:hypothetical protein
MSTFKYTVGLSNVGSYQVSGMPFATGSLTIPASGSTPLKIEFPYVTQWISVTNTNSKHVRLGFSENGVKNGGHNYVLIHEDNHPAEHTYNLKLSELYLLSDTGQSVANFSVVAGLTNIPVERINNLSGSDDIVGNNWSGSIGVG